MCQHIKALGQGPRVLRMTYFMDKTAGKVHNLFTYPLGADLVSVLKHVIIYKKRENEKLSEEKFVEVT
jgi:hypothetical protein